MQVPPFSLTKQLVDLGSDLEEAVLRVLKSGNYIGGEEVLTFEESFAATIGVPYAVGCNSGTDALVLALRALDIGEGDEVITCSFSFFATAESISSVGARPVFVDIDPSTYLMNLDDVENAITSSTKAILPVHLFGRPVNMDRLLELARTYNLKIIEDCAQASGAAWNGFSVGSFGDVGCFSFFPTKNLGGAGDGGAVTTRDEVLSKRMKQLAVHGMPRRYFHSELGYNSRLDAIQAAVLNVKLPYLEDWVKKRQDIADRYQRLLAGASGICLPANSTGVEKNAWNQFVVRLIPKSYSDENSLGDFSSHLSGGSAKNSSKIFRDFIKEELNNRGINTIIYYPMPIHLQPAYRDLNFQSGMLPVTEKICDQVLSLPIFPELSLEEQDKVVNTLLELLK